MLCFRLNYLITEPTIFIYTKPVPLYIKVAFTYRRFSTINLCHKEWLQWRVGEQSPQ